MLLLAQLGSWPPAERVGAGLLISGTFAATGAVALIGSKGRQLSWPVFFAIALLGWFGARW